jgi:hydroxymethylpyrimidine/phosphomethylpyrimidine kinase
VSLGGGPRVLLVGGLDPSGRAGLLADVETTRALGASPVALASALTAQGTRTFACAPVAPALLARQLAAAKELGPVQAIKSGALWSRAQLALLGRLSASARLPWVADPLVRTSRGERLSALTPADWRAAASPRVVLTPNLDEAGWLLGARRPLRSVADALAAGAELVGAGFGAVVLKGGHAERGAH